MEGDRLRAPMAARILDGKSLAAQVRPGLAVILAGDDPASKVYVRNKVRACEETGVASWLFEFRADVSQAALVEKVRELNRDPAVHGILVQLPLPRHVDSARVLEAVSTAFTRRISARCWPGSRGSSLARRQGSCAFSSTRAWRSPAVTRS